MASTTEEEEQPKEEEQPPLPPSRLTRGLEFKRYDPPKPRPPPSEGILDDDLSKQLTMRNRTPDYKKLYTVHLNNVLESVSDELHTRDPGIVPKVNPCYKYDIQKI